MKKDSGDNYLDNADYFEEEDDLKIDDFEELNTDKIINSEDFVVEKIEDLEANNTKDYWNEDTEQAIINFLYLNEFFYDNRIKEEIDEATKEKRAINKSYCEDMEQRKQDVLLIQNREASREKIFREQIKIPLKKLVENILFNYRLFIPGLDIKTQEGDCYTFLYMKFTNFNPWKKTKSFSYYGTVAKHYFLGKRKDSGKETTVLSDYESHKEEADSSELDEIDLFKQKDKSYDLFNHIIKTIERDLEKGVLTKNDQKVGDAIVQIFKNHEIIGIYNKNQVYQLIKEITKLETKDVTYSLHRFRMGYKTLKQQFIDKDR